MIALGYLYGQPCIRWILNGRLYLRFWWEYLTGAQRSLEIEDVYTVKPAMREALKSREGRTLFNPIKDNWPARWR